LATESSDDLITPGTLEVPAANGLQLQPTTTGAVPAAPVPLPPAPQQCLFCGGLGSTSMCGALNPAIIDGEQGAVHHLCAIWAPGCYLPEVGARCWCWATALAPVMCSNTWHCRAGCLHLHQPGG
jgi:hypothetical protein